MNEPSLVKLVANYLRAKAETQQEFQEEMQNFEEDDLGLPVPSTFKQVSDGPAGGTIS